MSWELSCWNEDNLSNKKLHPKHQYPAMHKNWAARCRTSMESMVLFATRVHATHESQAPYMRKKLESHAAEELSVRAATAFSIVTEVAKATPVTLRALETDFLQPWANGSEHIDLELQAAIMDQAEFFDPCSLPSIKRIIDAHLFNAPMGVEVVTSTEEIAADDFALLMKQLRWDADAFEVWTKKCSNVRTARYRKEQELKVQKKTACDRASDKFMSTCVKLVVWDGKPGAEEGIKHCMNFKREHIHLRMGCDDQHVVSMPVLNWTSPSLIPDHYQSFQCGLLSWALADNMSSVGLALYPVFTRNPGKLFMDEHKATKMLTQGNHNLDFTFTVVFKEPLDKRDQRPLMYPGRLVYPSPVKVVDHSFFNCDLRRYRRTEAVQQLRPLDMQSIEDTTLYV